MWKFQVSSSKNGWVIGLGMKWDTMCTVVVCILRFKGLYCLNSRAKAQSVRVWTIKYLSPVKYLLTVMSLSDNSADNCYFIHTRPYSTSKYKNTKDKTSKIIHCPNNFLVNRLASSCHLQKIIFSCKEPMCLFKFPKG